MRLRFTRHARNKMRHDHITEDDIGNCIEHPDATSPDILGRTNYVARYRDGRLHVTSIEEGSYQVIVTVILKRDK